MRLTRDQAEMMQGHARAAYPEECCGVIVGPPPGEANGDPRRLRLHLLRNLQDEMHARDPGSYPRTARRAFLVDPFELERILREARARGEVLRGIFHSHPDEDAYFSPEDRDAAVPFGDVPSYPEAVHIVMSVREGQVRGAKVFRWDRASQDFLAGDLDVVDRT
ncbi:MAG: Mov34/MPN/PAD-1 family protein [Candidatus Tectomicrobia bacterium]|uniref:Mov34/MPN/PAD-1 family protein n=1 Tax=Tectimicrobiota bacterium TaxID=2528274 RepID=A0A932ZUG7_UNCTE|nr:Mov34/MPN/PAD-1 family protein [Candidatus Tectomicrobia bacterium]